MSSRLRAPIRTIWCAQPWRLIAQLHASATAVTEGMDRVLQQHPGYSWVWTDQIRCRGNDCGQDLEIPLMRSTQVTADRIFESHRSAHLDAFLGEGQL